MTQREAVELRAVAEGVGLLRVQGDRLEANSLRNAWAQIGEGLRAGLVFAAWCHGVDWSGRFRSPAWSLVVRVQETFGCGRKAPMATSQPKPPTACLCGTNELT